MSETTWRESGLAGEDARYIAYMIVAVLAMAVLMALPLFMQDETQVFYVSEGGPIQVFSAAGYLVVVVMLFREWQPADLLKHWYFVVIPLAMCLREMDFHSHFTTLGMTKTLFYVSPDVPLIEKMLGVAVFALLGLSVYLLIARHGVSFLRGLRQRELPAIAIAAAAASAVFSKGLDGAARNLAEIGIIMPHQLNYPSIVFEEVLELGIPVFLAIAAFSYASHGQRRR